jgi:hypothetical protein
VTVVERWALVVADFHHLLGVDLEAVFWGRSWRWFETRLCALLAYPESLLGCSIDADEKNTHPADGVPAPPTDADMMGSVAA